MSSLRFSLAVPSLLLLSMTACGSSGRSTSNPALPQPSLDAASDADETVPPDQRMPDAAVSSDGGADLVDARTIDVVKPEAVRPNPYVCRTGCCPTFVSGLNAAWVRFAADVPNPNIGRFDTLFRDTAAAGGRVVRWWLHTNGTITPGYDDSGLALPIADADIAAIRKVLDSAQAAGVMLNISLWSFDMLRSGPIDSNLALLTQDANRQAYIDNVLTPLVVATKGHPALYSYEIFNEAEGMTTQNGWTATMIDQTAVQKCVNWFADAIHASDPAVAVTTGAWTFKVNSTVNRNRNYYSDAALRAVGGRANGTLDFYEVHYYDNFVGSEIISPFLHPASYWGLDKPIVIGEFLAIDTNGISAADLYTTLFDNGYAGAWAWQYISNGGAGQIKWPAMQVPMQNLLAAHQDDLVCPMTPPVVPSDAGQAEAF